jgi:hypothetical protein
MAKNAQQKSREFFSVAAVHEQYCNVLLKILQN